MKVVIINGSAQAGKDTFIRMCHQSPGVVIENISTIDMPKAILMEIGLWDGEAKGEKERQLMHDMKNMITRYNDGVFQNTINRVRGFECGHEHSAYKAAELIVFIHCREPEEIKKLKDYYYGNCITLLVVAGGQVGKIYNNQADRGVGDYEYDWVVRNDGSLQDLECKTAWFITEIKNIFQKSFNSG